MKVDLSMQKRLNEENVEFDTIDEREAAKSFFKRLRYFDASVITLYIGATGSVYEQVMDAVEDSIDDVEDWYRESGHAIQVLDEEEHFIRLDTFDINMVSLNAERKPTEKQIKVLCKALAFYVGGDITEVSIRLFANNSFLEMEKDEDCIKSLGLHDNSLESVTNAINKLYQGINEDMEFEPSRPVRAQKVSDYDFNSFQDHYGELSKQSFYISDSGVEVLKLWAEQHDSDMFSWLDSDYDMHNKKVILSKIKPSFKSSSINRNDYWNVFLLDYDWGEKQWVGAVPKNVGEELLYIHEDLNDDSFDIRRHSSYDSVSESGDHIVYTYKDEQCNSFIEDLLESPLTLYKSEKEKLEKLKTILLDNKNIINRICLNVWRNENRHLVDVVIEFYYYTFRYYRIERVVEDGKAANFMSFLGIEE